MITVISSLSSDRALRSVTYPYIEYNLCYLAVNIYLNLKKVTISRLFKHPLINALLEEKLNWFSIKTPKLFNYSLPR